MTFMLLLCNQNSGGDSIATSIQCCQISLDESTSFQRLLPNASDIFSCFPARLIITALRSNMYPETVEAIQKIADQVITLVCIPVA